MPTINAGASATVALPAGQTMAFNFGAGTAQVVPTEPASVAPPLVNVTVGATVGPFEQPVSVFVRALQFTDYEVRTPADILDRTGRAVLSAVVLPTLADLTTAATAGALVPGTTYTVGLARYRALSATEFQLERTMWKDAAGGAPRTVTGTLTETTIFSRTIPVEFFHPNVTLWVEPFWTYTNNANNKIIRVRVGGQIIHQATATTTNNWYRPTILQWRNSLTAQIARSLGDTSIFANSGNNAPTYTIDPSSGVLVEVSFQLANIADSATLEVMRIIAE